MNLSSREKILISVLAITILCLGIYYLVLGPMLSKLENYKIALNETKNKVDIVTNKLKLQNTLKEQYEDLSKEIIETNDRYYTDIVQENIIVLFEDMIDKSNISANSIAFSKIEVQNINNSFENDDNKTSFDEFFNNENISEEFKDETDEINIKKMSLYISFEASYDELMDFIENIEKNDKKLYISNLYMSKSEGILSGDLTIDIYVIPSLFDDYNEVFDYNFNIQSGKNNPFM